MPQFAAVVVMYDRGGEEDIERVLVYDSRAEAVNFAEMLAAGIIKENEWDDPLLNHEITQEGSTWLVDGEPVFTIVIRPVEHK